MVGAVARDGVRNASSASCSRPLPPSVIPSAFQAGALPGSTATASRGWRAPRRSVRDRAAAHRGAGGRRHPSAGAAARPRTPLRLPPDAAAADEIRVEDRQLCALWILRTAVAHDGERRRRSAGRQTRVGPSGPRVLEPRRTPRRLLEVRRRPIGTLQSRERSREIQVQLEALDAVIDQILERPRRGGEVAPVQREDAGAHSVVGAAELVDLVLRIGAGRCGRRRVAAAHVAERAEAFELIRWQRPRRCRLRDTAFTIEQLRQRAAKRGGAIGLRRDEVVLLVRVGRQIEELRLRCEDVFPRSSTQHAQIAPPEMQQRDQRFGVLRALGRRSCAASQRTGEIVA